LPEQTAIPNHSAQADLSSKPDAPTVQTLLLSGAQLTMPPSTPPARTDTLPHSIHRAMRHSTFAGGKRLRPILCMEAAKMVGPQTTTPKAFLTWAQR